MLSLQPSLDYLSPGDCPLLPWLWGPFPPQQGVEVRVSAPDSSGCRGDGHLSAAVLGLGALPSSALSLGAGTGSEVVFAPLTALAEGSHCRQAVSTVCKVSKAGQGSLSVPSVPPGCPVKASPLCRRPGLAVPLFPQLHGALWWLLEHLQSGKGLRPQRHV